MRAIEWIESHVCRSGAQQFNFKDIADGTGASIETVRSVLPHGNANGVTFWLSEEAFEKIQRVVSARVSLGVNAARH